MSGRGRALLLLLATVIGATAVPAVQSLERPANDDFRSAQHLTEPLPFTATVDLTFATPEPLEPLCDRAPHTVWYRYEAGASSALTAYATSATAVASVAVYRGTDLLDLEQEACWASDSQSQRGLTFEAVAGTTYWIQVGADAPATVALEFGGLARMTGTVTDESASPLEDICVFLVNVVAAGQGDPYAWEEGAITGGDGGYEIETAAAGPAVVLFLDCSGSRRPASFYDDAAALDDAQIVHLPAGGAVHGVDAVLGPPGGPPPSFDRAITSVVVDEQVVGGFRRPEQVLVTVENHGPDTAPSSDLLLRACPASGLARCNLSTYVTVLDLEPGEVRTLAVPWDGEGAVGDMTVTASLFGDRDLSNNQRSTQTSVLLPLGGFGVSVGRR